MTETEDKSFDAPTETPEAKIETGKASEVSKPTTATVENIKTTAARALVSLAKKFNSLEGVEVLNAIGVSRLAVLLTKEGDGAKVVGREGSMAKLIAKELGKPIRVVEPENPRRMFEGILMPATLIGLNVLYRPEGTQEFKVRVPIRDKPLLQLNTEELNAISKEMVGRPAALVFE